MPHELLTIGIDLGTGGVRAVAATMQGDVLARAAAAFPRSTNVRHAGRHEQVPQDWWRAVCLVCNALTERLQASGALTSQMAGLAVDGTSGTIVAVDAAGQALRPALMYNDTRAAAEAQALRDLSRAAGCKPPSGLDASFGLAKIEWLRRHEPQVIEQTARFVHQADYIVGRLTGELGVTDDSNALKTGYDLVLERWPEWLTRLPGVADRLPRVVPPGTCIGSLSPAAAAETGLPVGLPVLAGATDGTAACMASGLRRAGDYNTTLGTTLVFKGMSRQPLEADDQPIYSHKLPGGWWLPGAASNTGCEWIGAWFGGRKLRQMDKAAGAILPGGYVCYPLVRRGERFPFACSEAEGFWLPARPEDPNQSYAACLVGTALVERLAYQILDRQSVARAARCIARAAAAAATYGCNAVPTRPAARCTGPRRRNRRLAARYWPRRAQCMAILTRPSKRWCISSGASIRERK